MNIPPEPLDGLPSGSMPSPFRSAAESETDLTDGFDTPRRKVSPGLVWRALRRHWWQVGLLWAISSAVLVAFVHSMVKPTYDAVARVQVDPGEQSLYTNKSVTPLEFAEFKETQVASVTSPVVLSLALTDHPDLFQLPMLQHADDGEAQVRRALRVMILPKTNLIELSMSSTSPIEAARIVNAVLDAYLKNASKTSNEDTEQLIARLKVARDSRARELEQKRLEWRRLSDRVGATDGAGVKDRNLITPEDYRQYSDQLFQVEMARYAAEAKIAQLQGEKQLPDDPGARAQLDQEVRDAFYADPKIDSLRRELDALRLKYDNAKRLTRNTRDPARVNIEKRIQSLNNLLKEWWTRLRPTIEQQMLAGRSGDGNDRLIAETELQLASLRTQENQLRTTLDQMKIKSRDAGGAALELAFADHDTQRSAALLHKVEDQLNQLEHEARSPIARVRKVFEARPSNRPNANHRTKMMALVPPVMFLVVLGLFVLLELRAGRVADPDELSSRTRVQILGVVPPLPALRSSSGSGVLARRGEFRMQRQLDEFVQSLDHLRVILCARPDPWGRDRHCVLITSACGSEGKTTLAAQLAERCVNAGLMTLLIDADLRNPTLSRMLDANESAGLINVLRGEATPESVMRVVGDAGGFHFLPAGTPRLDPSRILQGDALGKLLAQARESFDMIIVDAPPVLPVPDALMIGRWTDGALLAVRYDTSRFALVERAQRRLAHVGVPVIGAVVNGVRTTEASYGGYYAYGTTEQVTD